MLSKVPPWAVDAVLGLVQAVGKLLSAESDEEREEALMEAAEAPKAALDRRKFG